MLNKKLLIRIALPIILVIVVTFATLVLINIFNPISTIQTTIPVSYADTAPVSSPSENESVDEIPVVNPQEVDFTDLETQINNILGDNLSKYTIYLHDLNTDQVFNINVGKIVEPASIAKLPVAVLVMRDVDAGKITLEDTFAFDNSKKFGSVGNLGNLADGTLITFRQYLEELLEHSDNNAWYMLVNYLGGSYQVVNPRIMAELDVNPLFLDPPQGTARAVGQILSDIYSATTVTKKSSDYLISLMQKADVWAKAGIGLGLPEGIVFANKIGTLDDNGKLSYQDAAIVWGPTTQYVLVIMDEDTEWDVGQIVIKDISKVVYNYLN